MACQTNRDIDVQGHRGARGLMPENTLPAFEKAIELGVNTLELDVVVSKDKKVVVSHEPFMNSMICLKPDGSEILESEEKGLNLYEMTYDSIIQYDCGIKDHPIFTSQQKVEVYKPLLNQVIQEAEDLTNNSINYNIEIKSRPSYDGVYTPKVGEFVKLVMDVINETGIKARTTLQSFDLRALEEIHRSDSKIDIALLVDSDEDIDSKLSDLSFRPTIISPEFSLLDAAVVSSYQSIGIKVIPWTVNEIGDMGRMMSMNVDGIITDYPDRLKEMISKANK